MNNNPPVQFPLIDYYFSYKQVGCKLKIPDAKLVQQQYNASIKSPTASFPFWARLWPSAVALSEFLVDDSELVANKTVLELAAGVGLPSFVSAILGARGVTVSDYSIEAVNLLQHNITASHSHNINQQQLDWHKLPAGLYADVLLMSDVNYNPAEFPALAKLFKHFIVQDTTIVLSTPHRMIARPFISQILPWCINQQHKQIYEGDVLHDITVFVFRQQH